MRYISEWIGSLLFFTEIVILFSQNLELNSNPESFGILRGHQQWQGNRYCTCYQGATEIFQFICNLWHHVTHYSVYTFPMNIKWWTRNGPDLISPWYHCFNFGPVLSHHGVFSGMLIPYLNVRFYIKSLGDCRCYFHELNVRYLNMLNSP